MKVILKNLFSPARLILILSMGFSTSLLADFSVQEISDGVYVHLGLHEQIDFHNKGDIANIGFVVGKKSVAVIDAGGSRYVGQALKEEISRITNLPIRYVILTHAHPDHIFGLNALVNDNTDVVGHKNLSQAMIQRSEFYSQRLQDQYGFKADDLKLVAQSIFVEDEIELDLGGRKLHLFALSTAHTDHDLVVLDNQTKVLWTGDLLFRQRVPVIDGSVLGWIEQMKFLQSLDSQYIVPGHGQVISSSPDAFVNQRRYLVNLINGTRKMIDQGASIQDAIKTVAKDEKDLWLLFSDHHQQNISRAFTEIEWQ